MKNRKTTLAIVVALSLFSALASALWIDHFVLNHPVEHGVENSDIFTLTYPHWVYIANELQEGNLPLWNPYQLAGQPFLGLHVPALLYPPNLFLLSILEPGQALAAHAVLHIALAGIFMWLFCGRLGLGTGARFASSLAYMLSGPALHAIYVPNFFSNLVWLPAILWALHGLLSEARARWAVALAAFASCAFLGGHVQAFVYVAQFATAYAVFGLIFVTPPGKRARVAGLSAAASLLVVGFSGPQLVPAIEMAQKAVRDFEGLSLEQAMFYPVAAGDLLSGIMGRFVAPPTFFPFFTLVLPTLTIPLIFCGVLVRERWATWLFFVVGASIAGAFMLGPATPVFPFYHSLPLGDLFRAPRRMDFLYVFLVCVLLGIGLQALKERLRELLSRPIVSTAVVLACVTVIGVESYSRIHLKWAHPASGPFTDQAAPELLGHMQKQPGHPRFFLEPNRAIWTPRLSVKTGMMNEVFVLPDYEASMPQDYANYFALPAQSVPWHGRLSVLSHARAQPPEILGKLLDLMSVRFYAIWNPWPPAIKELEGFASKERVTVGNVAVFERPTALPRVYTVRRALYEADLQAALDRITTDAFRPRDEAVLVSTFQQPVDSHTRTSKTDVAEITDYSAEKVSVTAECHSTCLLVLTDLYYPGWRVFVDGNESEIQRVNGLFRGVWLETGRHQIAYRYEPTSFRVGLWMFAGSLLASLILVFLDRSYDLGTPGREH